MSGQLIAELTLKWLSNWSSLFCHAKIRRKLNFCNTWSAKNSHS